MQWTGQKVMFDLRKQIFRHLQHIHVGVLRQEPGRAAGDARDHRR